jgi:glutamyl-tRNA reductase
VLVGLNFRTAELGIRERAAIPPECVGITLAQLVRRPAIQEAIILSTCNRVEVISKVQETAAGLESLEGFLSEKAGIPLPQLQPQLYRYTERQAVQHVLRVACSLDSMMLGEPQILGQVKSSYTLARDARTAGTFLNTLMQAAFRVAKRVRTETSIGAYSVSVSSAAVELATKILGDLRDSSVLIVGAGKMGEGAVRHLAAGGAGCIRVTNRSRDAAEELADRFRGSAVPFEELTAWMARSDVIIVSTASPHVLIDRALAQSVMSARKNRPMVLIDISVPRNVAPGVAAIDNVFCYDIDDLGAVVEANLQERRREASQAERIVDAEAQSICERIQSLDMTPVVTQLQDRIGNICRSELDRYLRRSGTQEPDRVQELEAMVGRIANKIIHPLVTQLKSVHRDPGSEEADLATIRRIFDIQKDQS